MKKSYLSWCLILILDHLLAVLGSILIFGFLGAWEYWIVQALCAVLYLALALAIPYHESWKIGVAEHNAHKRDNPALSPIRGLIAGLLAAIPSFAVALFSFLCAVNGWTFGILFDQNISEFIYRIWFFPFSPLFTYLTALPWLYFVPVLVTPIASAVGYAFGSRKLMLRDYLYYHREKDGSK